MQRVAGGRILIERIRLKPGMRVLDVGCGPGRLTIPFAKCVGRHGEVVALDIQGEMLRELRRRVEENGLTNVKAVLGGAGEGHIQELNAFDRAVLVTVLGEIPDKKKALKEIYNALKPGGLLSVTEVLPDLDYQKRSTVLSLAREAGFTPEDKYGNMLVLTLNFSKPKSAQRIHRGYPMNPSFSHLFMRSMGDELRNGLQRAWPLRLQSVDGGSVMPTLRDDETMDHLACVMPPG